VHPSTTIGDANGNVQRFFEVKGRATLLKTSRSQVDRLLDPTRDVTLSTLQRAAALVGRKVQIELV
jgi:hypothetical protein